MVDGNGDDERKTKYFILSIFICVFAGSFQEKVFKIRYVPNYLVEKWSNPTNLVKKWDKPNFTIHRIVWSTEIFDFSNYLVRWIIRLSESIDSPIFLMHRIRKTRKKYGYNISSVNGVAKFVKERLYPYNGTQQVLWNGIALECYDIEGQGSTDWSVHEKELYFPDSQEFWTFELNIFPLKTGHRPLIRTGPWSPV